jgi:hypothetical protein
MIATMVVQALVETLDRESLKTTVAVQAVAQMAKKLK